MKHQYLRPSETTLVGNWIERAGKVVGDEACNRVNWLVERVLEEVAVSSQSGGWDTLYRDPADGRYWERTYPHSEWHGGGPPTLACISEEAAKKKYAALSGEPLP